MNNVYDRPLFAGKMKKQRDARTKLLNMGGIISSSPELMAAAQPLNTMMSPVTQQRNMNQGGYIPGYDAGGFIHNMKHRREENGLPSILEQLKTGTIPPVNEQPSYTNSIQPGLNAMIDGVNTSGEMLIGAPANAVNSMLSGTKGVLTDLLGEALIQNNAPGAGESLKASADAAYLDSQKQIQAANSLLFGGLPGINVDAEAGSLTDTTLEVPVDDLDSNMYGTDMPDLGVASEEQRAYELETLALAQAKALELQKILADKEKTDKEKAADAAELGGATLTGIHNGCGQRSRGLG